jgi:hypothetical protein
MERLDLYREKLLLNHEYDNFPAKVFFVKKLRGIIDDPIRGFNSK